jgi:pyruvate kinase
VATLGPASASPAAVRSLTAAGVDVFRLNFSHGDHQSHARLIDIVREAAADAPEPVAILADLQGPRIRTGRLRGRAPVTLREGDEVTLADGEFDGDSRRIPVTYEGLARDVTPGDAVLLSDGLIELRVLATDDGEARCRVAVGGELHEKQGINLPGVDVSISSPTDKDLADLRFAMDREVDFVALSFVRSPADLLKLKAAMVEMAGAEHSLPVVAKIEKPEAVDCLDDILAVSDGVMVARGDLGIEMATEAVPAVQKKIIRAANRVGVPVITATQMLESMVSNPRPTRAEASDVANAILDGTDAVMLSAETSIGRFAVQAVRTMDNIARETEAHMRSGRYSRPDVEETQNEAEHALAGAACMIAERLGAAGIVPFTLTGHTARYISQRRPGPPIYALTPDAGTCRRMTLLWGVLPIQLDVFETTDEMIEQGGTKLLELGLVSAGDTVVYVAGASTSTPGGTDMLKIHRFVS